MISRRSYGVIGLVVLVLIPVTTNAQDLTAKGRSPLVELRAEYDEATKAWETKYSGQRDAPSAQLIARYDAWPAWSFLPRIVKLGVADAKELYAFESLTWFVELSNAVGANDRQYYAFEEQVFTALRMDHLSNPQIADLFPACSCYPTPARERFLRECAEKGSTRDLRGLASYYLGELLRNKAEFASHFRSMKLDSDDPFRKHSFNRWSPEFVTFLRSVDSDKTLAESKALYQRVIDEFDDVKWRHEIPLFAPGKPTIGFMIRLRRAQSSASKIGEHAPNLAGNDLEGIERKLADYNGKVVVLHFWATWCSPCVEKIPRLQKLSEQYDSKQFCILGINYDRDRQSAMKFVKERMMTWPSWWATNLGESIGRLAPGGNWPDVIVIDHKGVLRYQDAEGDELDKAVNSLVQELLQDESSKR